MEHHVKVRWCFLVVVLFLSSYVSAQSSPTGTLSVVYTEAPSNVSSRTNATFGFAVVDANGANPCAAAQNCSFTCQVGLALHPVRLLRFEGFSVSNQILEDLGN